LLKTKNPIKLSDTIGRTRNHGIRPLRRMGLGNIRRRQKVQSSGDSEATKAKTPGASEAQQRTRKLQHGTSCHVVPIPRALYAVLRDELRLRLQCTMRFAEHYTGQQTANRVAIGASRPASSSLRYVCRPENHAGDRCVPTSRTFTLHLEWM
jgi:hypothetical protein